MSCVSLSRCADYRDDQVSAAVRACVDGLGGIGRFVHSGQRVLVKPNLLRAAPPERGVTTHPSVVKAVVRLVQEAGGRAIIADSPSGPGSRAYLSVVYERTGMTGVARETGAELSYDLRKATVPFPAGHLLKEFEVLALAAEADVIINLPKLKTHNLTLLTGAVKNLFGLIPGTVKVTHHARLPDRDRFSGLLVDIHSCCRPALAIMDAVEGMDGNGPSSGRLRQMGLLLASEDGLALDLAAAAIVGIAPLAVPTLAAAARWGLVSGKAEEIEFIGLSLEEARLSPPFAAPATYERALAARPSLFLHLWPANLLGLYPSANERCTACGTCVANCPVGAISIVGRRALMDVRKCIRCYCCHETCPHDAVILKRRPLARLFAR